MRLPGQYLFHAITIQLVVYDYLTPSNHSLIEIFLSRQVVLFKTQIVYQYFDKHHVISENDF